MYTEFFGALSRQVREAIGLSKTPNHEEEEVKS
jgi:hypothetical protein